MSNILDILEINGRKTPDKAAVSDENSTYTYEELIDMAKRAASSLIHYRREAVVILCGRNIESIAAIWGVIYSGNFYVPLDEKINLTRFEKILNQLKPRAVIINKDRDDINQCCGRYKIDLLSFQQIAGDTIKIEEIKLQQIRKTMMTEDPLYMVYTSGSTGTPKGIIKTQRSLLCFLQAFRKITDFSQDDIYGNQAGFDYDAAAKDLFMSIYTNASMVIIPSKCFLMPLELIDFLNNHKITVLIWSAAAVRYVAANKSLEIKSPSGIRKVMFSGEELRPQELMIWKKHLPDTEYINLYAPSEVTGNCMYYSMKGEKIPAERLPLGSPFPETEIMVLDDKLQPVSEGQTGEIYVRGPFLSSGYYMDREKTDAAFIQNPVNARYKDMVYRTGDRAVLAKGFYYFAGRTDQQIKHMGHRIELGEIEQTVYQSVKEVSACCAIYDNYNKKIVLFLRGLMISDKQMTKCLISQIPKYMLPSQYIWLEKFPENDRGKLDRLKLQEIYYNKFGKENANASK